MFVNFLVRASSIIMQQLIGRFVRIRQMSSYKYIDVSNLSGNIFSIGMNKAPVNSLSLEFMEELKLCIKHLEQSESCKAIVFTSQRKAFSAGFDINEFVNPKLERLKRFWGAAQDLALTLLKTPLVTASAINGSCIAGGCVFAFLSDISVMNHNESLRIGLSATKMGIAPPELLLFPMIHLVGHRKTELLASQSVMLSPVKAKEIGLIQTTTDADNVVPKTIQIVESYLAIPETGRVTTKQIFNKEMLAKLDTKENLIKETEKFTAILRTAEIQNLIEIHLQNIKKM